MGTLSEFLDCLDDHAHLVVVAEEVLFEGNVMDFVLFSVDG